MARQSKKKTPQELVFACIRASSFNSFDGEKVVKMLKENARLWEAVIFADGVYCGAMTLRDLPDVLHMSTLFVRSSGADDGALVLLMKKMLRADEVNWMDELPPGALGSFAPDFKRQIKDRRVLRCWWG